jgi:hypothetical protein
MGSWNLCPGAPCLALQNTSPEQLHQLVIKLLQRYTLVSHGKVVVYQRPYIQTHY